MAKVTSHQVALQLLVLLQEGGLDARLKTTARTGSCYLTLGDPRLGQVRIGDHDERERYGYRWQVRLDAKFPYIDETKGHRRFFYPPDRLARLTNHILNYRNTIEREAKEMAIKFGIK